MKNAETAIGNSDGVMIPDKYLLSGVNVVAWVFLHDGENDGETEYVVRIPVRPRSKLENAETPEEHSIVSDLIAIVNELQEQNTEMARIIEALEERTPALGGWKTDSEG